MHGEIFCFDEQESEVLYVTQLLRRHVYPAIRVTVHQLGAYEKWAEISQSACRFGRLMQAAIPPASTLRVYPKEFSASGCMYIEVLYRTTIYEHDYATSEQFFQQDLGSFFPAVALHDRMYLVSERLASKLGSRAKGKRAFRTLPKAGVLPVDFTDDDALEAAVVAVGMQVRGEVTSELAAYASYEKDWNLDLSRVAGYLNVAPGYIIHCLQAGAVDRVVGRQLECRLDAARVPLDAWTKMNLTIRNESELPVEGAEVIVAGPVKIRPGRLYVDLPAKSTTQVALAVMPLEAGDVPLEFTFANPADRPFSNWLPAHHVWLKCESREKPVKSQGKPALRRLPKAMGRQASG